MLVKKKRVFAIAILLAWTALVTLFSLVFAPHKPYIPTFFYFVAPSLYLAWKYPVNRKKVLMGALLIGILIPLSFDLLTNLNGAWIVPADKLLIPFQPFGFYPIDEIIWFFFVALYTLVFYEVFVDNEKILRLSRNFKTAVLLWVIAIITTVVCILLAREFLLIRYPYLFIVAPSVFPPLVYIAYTKPWLLKKFIVPTIFFLFVSLNFEFVALRLGHWAFKNEYLGWVFLLGQSFPLEEFLYWMLLYPAAALSYYELLVDDGR